MLTSRRLTKFAGLAAILGLCLVSAPVLRAGAGSKAPKPPADISGTWYGDFKAGKDTGTVDLSVTQYGADCTFTATAHGDDGSTVYVNGTLVMNGSKAEGDATIDDGSIITAGVKGKISEKSGALKLTFSSADGKAKVTLYRPI